MEEEFDVKFLVVRQLRAHKHSAVLVFGSAFTLQQEEGLNTAPQLLQPALSSLGLLRSHKRIHECRV